MSTSVVSPPATSEYYEYYGRYIGLVGHADIIAGLRTQLDATMSILETISDTQSLYRYAPGKWSIREVLGHLSDTERIFTYRALRIARADTTPLPGFEQDDYVKTSDADRREWDALKEEFDLIRRSTIAFYKGLEPEAWLRRGTASEKPVSVRALAWMTAGHELHHLNILRERYLRRENIA